MPQKQDAGVNSQMVEELGDVLDIIAAAEYAFARTEAHHRYYDARFKTVRLAIAAIAPDDRLREAAIELALAAGKLNVALDGQEKYRRLRLAVNASMEKIAALSLPLNKETRQTLCNDGSCMKPEPQNSQMVEACPFCGRPGWIESSSQSSLSWPLWDHTSQCPVNAAQMYPNPEEAAKAGNARAAITDRLREALELIADDTSWRGFSPLAVVDRMREHARAALSLPLNKDRQTLCNDGSCAKPEPHIQGAAGCVFARATLSGNSDGVGK